MLELKKQFEGYFSENWQTHAEKPCRDAITDYSIILLHTQPQQLGNQHGVMFKGSWVLKGHGIPKQMAGNSARELGLHHVVKYECDCFVSTFASRRFTPLKPDGYTGT